MRPRLWGETKKMLIKGGQGGEEGRGLAEGGGLLIFLRDIIIMGELLYMGPIDGRLRGERKERGSYLSEEGWRPVNVGGGNTFFGVGGEWHRLIRFSKYCSWNEERNGWGHG